MRNNAVLLTLGVSLLVVGIIVWYVSAIYIPKEKLRIDGVYKSQYATVPVFMVDNDAGLFSNTIISEDLFAQKTIIPVDVPATFLPKDKDGNILAIMDKGLMLKHITSRKLAKGEFIMSSDFLENSDFPADQQYKRRKEYTFKNNVAGEVKTGCLVDVMVNYMTGDYDVVIPKIKVEKVVSTTATAAPAGEAAGSPTGEVTVILAVDEMQFRDIELASKMGDLQARVYEDELQITSMQTFQYGAMKELVKSIALEKNLSGDIDKYSSSAYIGFYGEKADMADKLAGELKKYEDLKKLNAELAKQKAVAEAQQKTTVAPKTSTPSVTTPPVVTPPVVTSPVVTQ